MSSEKMQMDGQQFTGQPSTGNRSGARAAHKTAEKVHEPRGFGALMAAAWADTIIHYWEAAYRRGEIDGNAPLDLLDLAPGRGWTAWLMLQALCRRIATMRDFKPQVRFLAAASQREMLNWLRSQTELLPWLNEGMLIPTLWDPGKGDPCLLTQTKRIAWRPDNPLVVIAHDFWSTLPNRLLAVHYGALLEADIEQLSLQQGESEKEAKLWSPVSDKSWPYSLQKLIDRYLMQFNSTPITLPIGALRVIDRIATLASRGYLILSAANGVTSENSLRLCQFSELMSNYRKNKSVPVNFHLLANHYEDLGAAAWQKELSGGLAIQAALGGGVDPRDHLMRTVTALENGSCGDAALLADAMRGLDTRASSEVRLALLRHSEYDPQVFNAACPALHKTMRSETSYNRQGWREALNQVWMNHFPAHETIPLHRTLVPVAMQVGDWVLAKQALKSGMSVHGENATDLAYLAWCQMRTGQLTDAARLSGRALKSDRNNETAIEVNNRVQARLAALDDIWRINMQHATLPLLLEPLDQSHAEALFYQYRDPQIAVMTGLSPLASVEETRKWIGDEVQEKGKYPYAVMHEDFGLVGYVSLAVSEHACFFCFWIGVDFQHRGFSIEAGHMACSIARKCGISYIFTAAYHDNVRSIRSLQRIGFVPLEIRALPPDDDRLFLFLVDKVESQPNPTAELIAYYQREDLPLKFPPINMTDTIDKADKADKADTP